MRIIRLKKHQTDFFLGLDPFDRVRDADAREEHMLGAVTNIPGQDGDIPSGLLMYRMDEKRLVITWLYVAPEQRRSGVGELLLAASFAIARHAGKEEVGVELYPDMYGWNVVCSGGEIFLKAHYFYEDPLTSTKTLVAAVSDFYADRERAMVSMYSFDLLFSDILAEKESLPEEEGEEEAKALPRKIGDHDLVLQVKDLFDNKILSLGKVPPAVQSLGELTLPELNQGIISCLKVRPAKTFNEDLLALDFTWYETDVSACVVEDGEVTGLFLIHPDENGLWAEYLSAAGPHRDAHLLGMIRFVSRRIMEAYPKETHVILRKTDQVATALIKRVFES